MILIETPCKTIDEEIAHLESANTGPNMKLFTLGARAALSWLLRGGPAPSELLSHFPVGDPEWPLR